MGSFSLIFESITYKLQIKCLRCLGKSERYERMMDLTVEIDGDIGTLEDALRQFTAPEILEKNNKYNCGRFVGFLAIVTFLKLAYSFAWFHVCNQY